MPHPSPTPSIPTFSPGKEPQVAPREAPTDFTETYHIRLGIADVMKVLGGGGVIVVLVAALLLLLLFLLLLLRILDAYLMAPTLSGTRIFLKSHGSQLGS